MMMQRQEGVTGFRVQLDAKVWAFIGIGMLMQGYERVTGLRV